MKLYSKYQMTDGKQEICPQYSILILKATLKQHFRYIFISSDDLEIDLTSISFEKAFETRAGGRLASYSVMQDKHTLMSGYNRLT